MLQIDDSTTTHFGRQQGFSMLELLIVIGLVALAAQLAYPVAVRSMKQKDLAHVVRQIASTMRSARAHSASIGVTQYVDFDINSATYESTVGQKAKQIPKPVTINLVSAKHLSRRIKGTRFAFYPDGSSSGGSIDLIGPRQHWRIDVLWLTGRIEFRRVAPNG